MFNQLKLNNMSKISDRKDFVLTILYVMLIFSLGMITVSYLSTGDYFFAHVSYTEESDPGGGTDDPPVIGDTCFEKLIAYDTEGVTNERLTTAKEFIKKHIDLTDAAYRDTVPKGFLVTTEMIEVMSLVHNNIRGSSSESTVGGFHVYFGDRETSGGSDVLIIVPLDEELDEYERDYYKVIDVSDEESAPCPMLCEGFNLLPPPPGG